MRSHEVSGIATAMPPDRRTRSHQRLREGSSMGQKTVRFSDLSGQLIMHDDALARIVVHEHPELGDAPVEIEALTEEAEIMEDATLRVAVIDLYLPDDIEPRRVVMEADAFDKLATQTSMAELLTAARPVRRSTRAAANGGARGRSRDGAPRPLLTGSVASSDRGAAAVEAASGGRRACQAFQRGRHFRRRQPRECLRRRQPRSQRSMKPRPAS